MKRLRITNSLTAGGSFVVLHHKTRHDHKVLTEDDCLFDGDVGSSLSA